MTNEMQNKLDTNFQSNQYKLLGFVRSKIQSVEEAEDLVQDVYLQALQSLNVLDAVDNLAGWLFTAARNKVIDWYRRKKMPLVSLDEDKSDGSSLHDILFDSSDEQWDEETWQLVSDAMIDCIEELPQKQKFVFIQNVIEGKTFRELASETGESINTLLARKRYAVQFLRTRLIDVKEILSKIER
jgi:RNA polymerase sigma factor (sigma-70 family)